MRVLWFSLTPSRYKAAKGLGYNGGGWIASLESELTKLRNVELGVAFIKGKEYIKDVCNGVIYYVMPVPQKKICDKINYFSNYSVQAEVAPYLSVFKRVVEDFSPDVIQIFGSESCLGFVQMVTNIPCILHIQGIINPYWNAFFPPNFSKKTYIYRNYLPLKILARYKELVSWENTCKRERELLGLTNYYVGRTEWDKVIANIFNPRAKYYYCSEVLRESFYCTPQHIFPMKMTVVSTMSGVMYKGLDLVLKTAFVIKHWGNVEFTWIVYGNTNNVSFFEQQTGIKAKEVNVDFRGVGTEEVICNALCNATAFAHTSYIDNSPNAICEAQMAGCPVVSTNVGGIASLIDHGETGVLVPANDPYQMAWHLIELYNNKSLSQHISIKSKEIAEKRHNKQQIVNDMMKIYNSILTDSK